MLIGIGKQKRGFSGEEGTTRRWNKGSMKLIFTANMTGCKITMETHLGLSMRSF